jgi:uncharacterized protein YecT (DUF1311 family)
MTRSFLPAPLAALLILFAAPALAAGVKVGKETIEKKTDAYEVSVEYPRTGNAALDADIAAWAKAQADDFVKLSTEDRQPEENPYALDVTYEVPRNDADWFAVVFTIYTDTGGAHPNTDFATMNYAMPDGWRIYLPEIFGGRKALEKISALAIADLTKRLTGPDGMSDADTIHGGAGPAWDNFQDFVLEPKVLHIDFPPYQVAAYAAGPQESDIPLASLKGFIRKDFRAPAASFDCAAAASPTEKAICADVALARLDRAVAEAYARNLKYESDATAKENIKQAQRAWLATRDTTCPDAAVQCLTGVYKTRLAELSKAEG